jgi:hypothetical protein
MKTLVTLALLMVLAVPATAAVVWDEGISGDLSTSEAAPTPIVFGLGSNTILGSCGAPADTRDYITFTIPAGQMLTVLNLLAFAPDNVAFCSFNSGNTSFIPSAATDPLFLAGIHINASLIGTNLMPLFDTGAVTTNSLPAPVLPAGTYCFLIQQTSQVTINYGLEFVLEGGVPVRGSTWGAIKGLYR